MNVINMASPSVTLDRIAETLRETHDLQIIVDNFSVCNFGCIYIYQHENMFIVCYNFFLTEKQFVAVVSYSYGKPYIWFSGFLED